MMEQLAAAWPVLWLLGAAIGSLIGVLLGPVVADWIFGSPNDWFNPESRHYIGKRHR